MLAAWIFDPVYNFFGTILAFFYSLVPNLGVAIILFTVVIMLALFPLTAKQAKSMMAMQRAQPEIKKIQAKHKNDKQKQNEEVMKFYQENKINPLAGCLPLVVQLPIFFALFRVLREPFQHVPVSSKLFHDFCTTAGHTALTKSACGKAPLLNHLGFLGMDLSQHATGVKSGIMDAVPYFLLVGLVIITSFVQTRQSRRNAPNMSSQMAMMQNVLPIGFGLFSLQFPAGLVLYYLISNVWRIGQQELIMRKITGPGLALSTGGAIDVKSKPVEPRTGGPTGLRKLFQLPAAGEGESEKPSNGSGGPKPAGSDPGKRPPPTTPRSNRKRKRR